MDDPALQLKRAMEAVSSHGEQSIHVDAQAVARLLLDLHGDLADEWAQAKLLESFRNDDVKLAGTWLTVCQAIDQIARQRPGRPH